MRRPRVVALHAGLYVAVVLSGFAAAYVLKGWLPHLLQTRRPARVLPDSDSPDDHKTSPGSSSQRDPSSKTDPRQTDMAPFLAPAPVAHSDHTFAAPNLDADMPAPSTRTLPPLRTHALPSPVPSGHAGSSLAINVDTMLSPISTGSFPTTSTEDSAQDETASRTNTSDTLADSFLDVLSPPPTHVITRRRSMRAHDLFAASHISFAELGSLVAPEDDI